MPGARYTQRLSNAGALLEFDPASGVQRGIDVSTLARGDVNLSGTFCGGSELYAAPSNVDALPELDPTSAARGVPAEARSEGKFDGICCAGGERYAAPLDANALLEIGIPTLLA